MKIKPYQCSMKMK